MTLSSYEFAREQCVFDVGWVPERYPMEHEGVETCQVAEMAIYAVKLSRAGLGDWWEDVERLTRNQLQSSQLTDGWWVDQAAIGVEGKPCPVDSCVTTDRVSQRVVGTFTGGYQKVEGVYLYTGPWHCCTGNGNRAWYFIWRHIVDETDGVLKVNMLLNRASQWADVDSYLPYQGKVVIRMKQSEQLHVRIPSWVPDEKILCRVDGEELKGTMDRRYLRIGKIETGSVVTVEFPLPRETKRIKVFDRDYTIDLKGFNVVNIWPRRAEIFHHFYTRSDYRSCVPRMIEVIRFTPENEMDW